MKSIVIAVLSGLVISGGSLAVVAASSDTSSGVSVTAPDASTPDGSLPDTSTPDVSTPDSSTPDVSTPDTSTPDVSTPSVTAIGATEYEVWDAGAVTVDFDGTTLTLIDVATAPGWSHRVEHAAGHEVEVTFTMDSRIVTFKAELELGGVEVEIEEESLTRAEGQHVLSAGPAGTVTITVADGVIVAIDVAASNGWTYTWELEGDEAEITFTDGTAVVEWEAEIDGGDLAVEIEWEQDDHDHDDDEDDDEDEDEDEEEEEEDEEEDED